MIGKTAHAPPRFGASERRRMAALCAPYGDEAGSASLADPAPMRIRRPAPKSRNRRKRP